MRIICRDFSGGPQFLVKLEFGNVDFCEGKKKPREKPLKQVREPTNNSTV
jgi:hypothetical protein